MDGTDGSQVTARGIIDAPARTRGPWPRPRGPVQNAPSSVRRCRFQFSSPGSVSSNHHNIILMKLRDKSAMVGRQAEVADLVLEQLAQRFDQLHVHARRQAAHIVGALDRHRRAAGEGDRADSIFLASASNTSMNSAPIVLRSSRGRSCRRARRELLARVGVDQRLLALVLAQEAVDHLALADRARTCAIAHSQQRTNICEVPPVPRQGHVGPRKVLLPPARLPGATLGKGWAECPGDVAVPEIAFPSRRCNKTGHNQQ